MAVTYRPRKRAVPYKTRLTGWLISENEGFGVTRRTPRHLCRRALSVPPRLPDRLRQPRGIAEEHLMAAVALDQTEQAEPLR